MGKRKDATRSCEKRRPLKIDTHVPDGGIPQKKRLRWYGHVQRRDKDEATRKILQMTVDGKRIRSRPKLKWRDLVKEDMARNQMDGD